MEKLRITSGKYRGRVIKSPTSATTHPMGSREKIALFNIISDFLPGAVVLDAFAGSGALGIEALSRGADRVVFVEKDPRAAKTIRNNLDELGAASYGKVYTCSVTKFTSKEDFDIVIADPPYDRFEISDIGSLAGLVKKSGVFVLSHPGEPPIIAGLSLLQTRKYARARISIYRNIAFL